MSKETLPNNSLLTISDARRDTVIATSPNFFRLRSHLQRESSVPAHTFSSEPEHEHPFPSFVSRNRGSRSLGQFVARPRARSGGRRQVQTRTRDVQRAEGLGSSDHPESVPG